jgi:acetylcholinesterase
VFQYTDWEHLGDGYINQKKIAEVVGDYFFICPTNLFAEKFAEQGTRVYYYYFTQVRPALRLSLSYFVLQLFRENTSLLLQGEKPDSIALYFIETMYFKIRTESVFDIFYLSRPIPPNIRFKI